MSNLDLIPRDLIGSSETPLDARFALELADRLDPANRIEPGQDLVAGDLEMMPFRDFMLSAWNIVEPNRRFVSNWHIDAIAEHLTAVALGKLRWLIINIPPRQGKSVITCILWMAWAWTWRPYLRWLFASYNWNFAKRDAVNCRHLIQSPWYRSTFGDSFHLMPDQNEKMRYHNNRRGFRISTSVGGGGIGEGGDIRVIDDPIKPRDIHSDVIRKGVNDWWRDTWSSRENDPKTACEVIIMQRLHENDLTGFITTAMPNKYELLVLPMRFDPGRRCVTKIEFQDPRQEEGELLNPERYGEAEVADLEAKLGESAPAQLQQDPTAPGGNIFKVYWWRFWVPPDMEITQAMYDRVTFRNEEGEQIQCPIIHLPRTIEKMQSWDMSFKDAERSSFVVGQVWGRRRADRILLDQIKGRMTFTATKEAVRKLTKKWPTATRKLIEDKANGTAVIDSLRTEVYGLVPVQVKESKIARAHAVSPVMESGNVYLPHPVVAPWVIGFIQEHAKFPNATNDDQVDACTQTLNRWLRGGGWTRGQSDEG